MNIFNRIKKIPQKFRKFYIRYMLKIQEWKLLFQMANDFGIKRIKWLTNYHEEDLGGKESYKQKVPVNSNGDPLPWYTYPSIEFFQQFDYSNSKIFEYGSGNSSRFWARKVELVISVESDLDWYNKVLSSLEPNQKLYLRCNKNEYINEIHKHKYDFDVVIIDGLYRYNCALEATKKIKKGGFIIVDNSDWHPNTCKYLRNNGYSQIDFIGSGPVNSYAWCTSIFFSGAFLLPRKNENEPIKVVGGIRQLSKYDVII